MDAGNPEIGAHSFQDRELLIPSPTANLAGVWKGHGEKNQNRCPAVF